MVLPKLGHLLLPFFVFWKCHTIFNRNTVKGACNEKGKKRFTRSWERWAFWLIDILDTKKATPQKCIEPTVLSYLFHIKQKKIYNSKNTVFPPKSRLLDPVRLLPIMHTKVQFLKKKLTDNTVYVFPQKKGSARAQCLKENPYIRASKDN